MTKPRYVYNWRWRFWAHNGGPIGYLYSNWGWRYCFIEPDGDRQALMIFMLPKVTKLP